MKQVKFLEKLLDGAGVEWVPLGKALPIQRGKRLVRSQLKEDGKYPVYQNSLQALGFYDERNCRANMTFVIAAGAAGEIGFSETEFWAADDCYYLDCPKEILKDKFLYHFLLSKKSSILAQVRKASIPRIGRDVVENIKVPIPCPENTEKSLAIQSEIVRILDALTAATSELSIQLASELGARKKQYEYYRDALLTFDTYTDSASKQVSNMQWINLSEVVEIRSGWGFPKTFQGKSSGAYPFYKVSDMNLVGNESLMKKSNNFIDEISAEKLGVTPAPAGTVIFPKIGAAIATNKKRLLSTPSAYDNNIMGLIPKDCIAPRFLFFWMQTVNLVELANDSGAVPSIRKSEMEKLKFPLLPIEKQNRIVAILDKFDTLTHSITEGLPREIALRQKQYAYYRDLLFNFPQPV